MKRAVAFKNIVLLGILMVTTLPVLSFPLRNGDFSVRQRPGLVANWNFTTQSGKYTYNSSFGSGIQYPASEAIIKAVKAGRALYYQDVQVMKGTYLFEVDVKLSKEAKAAVNLAGKNINVSGIDNWEKISIEFSAEKSIRIHLISLGGGIVRFKNAKLEIKQLDSSTVKFADGTTLGMIELADNSSECEKFAAYELQKYIWKMTGVVVGLKGRDKIFPGRSLQLGQAAATKALGKLKSLPADSYLVSRDGKNILLAGNTPTGTLYAAYDFLKTQGCGWFMPGSIGEVVPTKQTLTLSDQERIESPAYDVRGFYMCTARFFPGGGWIYFNLNDFLDWAVRNRMNTCWHGGKTFSFGAHRGYGHQQTLNHSWRKFLLDDHPEWWVLYKGKRVKKHVSGRSNQLCVSNRKLRDFVVKTVLKYFKENKSANIYALNTNDEPCYWCECSNCRALDSDAGKGKWVLDARNLPKISMTDRALNFVNEIADRVSKVYPNKQIELYCYGKNRKAPVREKVHSNVLIKYCYWPGTSLSDSILDMSIKYNKKVIKELDAWKSAGVKNFGLYDYGNWIAGDAPILRFFHTENSLRTFHNKWGFRHYMPESSNNFAASFMMYNLKARLLWNIKTNYKQVIRNICQEFYGPAGSAMLKYYMFMDEVLMQSKLWKSPGWNPNKMLEYNMPTLIKGWELLQKAQLKIKGDDLLEKRITIAQFGHAIMTVFIAQNISNDLSIKDKKFVLNAHKTANMLCRKYKIGLLRTSIAPLKNIYFKPAIKSTLFKLPLKWNFKIDPENIGMAEKWYKNNAGLKWDSIKTNKDWTIQGYNYHGTAWYAVKFVLPKNVQEEIKRNKIKPAIYFGAVDGTAKIFLNGIKIGEQKQPAGFMWDKAFTITLPNNFNPEIENELVVMVKKNKYAAGIWKPVSIVNLNRTSLSNAKVSSVELHKSANAVNAAGKEANSRSGWRLIGRQYIKEFKSLEDKSSTNGSYQFYVKGYNGGCIYYKFPTAIGKTYRVTYDVKGVVNACYAIVFVDAKREPLSSKIAGVASGPSNGFVQKAIYFTATTKMSCVGFRLTCKPGVVGSFYVDKVSIRALSKK